MTYGEEHVFIAQVQVVVPSGTAIIPATHLRPQKWLQLLRENRSAD